MTPDLHAMADDVKRGAAHVARCIDDAAEGKCTPEKLANAWDAYRMWMGRYRAEHNARFPTREER